MTISLKKFNRLKTRVSELQANSDKASGALSQVMERLASSYGCKTLKSADIKLAKQQKKVESLRKDYDRELACFELEWGDVLDDQPKKKR